MERGIIRKIAWGREATQKGNTTSEKHPDQREWGEGGHENIKEKGGEERREQRKGEERREDNKHKGETQHQENIQSKGKGRRGAT